MTSRHEPLISVRSLRLTSGSRKLSLDVYPGEAYAVMGRAASGKSHFLDVIGQEVKPADGTIDIFNELHIISSSERKRSTPWTILKKLQKEIDQTEVVQVLNALNLLNDRDTMLSRLSVGQVAACDLLPIFFGKSDIYLIDGQLDCLDPWTLESVLEMLQAKLAEDKVLLVATARPEIAEAFGNLILMKNSEAVFAGTVEELIESLGPLQITVEAEDPSTIKTVVEPFTVSAFVSPGRLEITSNKSQELAAKLLTEGYGNVKTVVMRERTLADCLAQY